jgi:hypothetical protein
MMDLPVNHFTATLLAFIRTADPGAVLTIVVLLAVCLRSIWVPFDGRVTSLSLLAFVFAIPVTWLVSLAPETHWSTRLFWRACVQNGAVAVVLWHLLLPRFLKKWPLHAEHPLPLPLDPDARPSLWREPVEKKREER